MRFIYKFYVKKIANELNRYKLTPIDGQDMKYYVKREHLFLLFKGKMESFKDYEYFEVIFDAVTLALNEIRPIETTEIKHAALKHAIDINKANEQELKEYSKSQEELPGMSNYQIQEVIERSLLYGKEFMTELMELLDKYPIKIEYTISEDGTYDYTQRKTSKLL